MKSLLFLLACLFSLPAFGQTPAKDANAQTQIEAVIEAFRTSIIDKDKPRFVALFLHDQVTWQSVKGDGLLQRVRQKRPDAAKVGINRQSNHLSFIDGIVGNKERVEEKFWNTRIDTDGDIASVTFDYSFHSGNRKTNHGKEAWHLVNTGDGWKIVSVIWSVNVDPMPEAGKPTTG
ncbi:MAG TPA: nuclear transport factor 2 family protein [Lysobacter sp.]